jgi:HlyD family secretion protein
MKWIQIIKTSIISLLAFAALVGGYIYFKRADKNPLEKYFTVKADRGSVRHTVTSTGTLQAVVTVQVGSQVSGRIQELHADFNSVVKNGQILAVIDPANFEAQRQRAEASLATALASVKNAEANLSNRKAELVSAKANLEVARVTQKESERQSIRAQGLFKDGLISEQDLDVAQVRFEQDTAKVHQAEAQVNQTEASVHSALAQQDQAAANVKQARAELEMAKVNLQYTNIISPIDGVVVERNVDIGQTVAASFQAPVLFLIANDLTKMQVIAQVDEADIGNISEKADAEFTVDAFPGQNFHGNISEIRLSSKLPGASTTSSSTATGGTGGTASNVVVYNVIIDVNNPQLKLRPGMTANVIFTVANAENTLKIPNSALRYRPADKDPQEIQKLLSSLPGAVSADTRQSISSSGVNTERGQVASAESSAQRTGGNDEGGNRGQRLGQGTGEGRPAGTRGNNRSNLTGRSGRRGGGTSLGSGGGAQAIIKQSTNERYGINAGLTVHFPQAEPPKPTWGVIWVLDAMAQPQPRRVELGITDGRETAVLAGELKEGDTIITGELNSDEATPQQTASPFRGPFGTPAGGGTRRGGR